MIHDAGMRTAWSDKHAIYTSFNGPGSGGNSIDDFFGPEIDSQAVEPNGVPYPTDTDWTHDDAATKQYDGYKVQAVINEINGYDHSGTQQVGIAGDPRDELPDRVGRREARLAEHADGPNAHGDLHGGARRARRLLSRGRPRHARCWPSALDYVNAQLQRMDDTIQADGRGRLDGDHHHGQARPVAAESAASYKRIEDGPIIDAINAAWTATAPERPDD